MNIPLDKTYYLIRFEVRRDGYGDYDSMDVLAGKIEKAELVNFLVQFDLTNVWGYGYYECKRDTRRSVYMNDFTCVSDDLTKLFNEVRSTNGGGYFQDWIEMEIREVFKEE